MRNGFAISLLTLIYAFFSAASFAQNPVKWSFTTKDVGNCQVDLIFTGLIDEGWCTYSQFVETDDGPDPTSFTFQNGTHFKLVGKAHESGEKTTAFDEFFNTNLTKFKHKSEKHGLKPQNSLISLGENFNFVKIQNLNKIRSELNFSLYNFAGCHFPEK